MLGASTPRYSPRKCERAWAKGVGFLWQGRPDWAAQCFEEAIHHDPTAADAWLGLHATGRRQPEAVDAMSRHSASFGAMRRKHNMPLVSQFDLGCYVSFRLETARDLWLAIVARLMDAGRAQEAWQALSQAYLDCNETRFACTRAAYLRGDWAAVLDVSRNITDGFLRDESQFYVAKALIEQHVFHEALNVLAPLPQELAREGRFDGEVAYARGLAHEGLQQPEEALQHFQYAFRCFPTLADVATRAQAATAAPAGQASPSADSVDSAAGAGSPVDGNDAAAREILLDEAMATLDGMVGLESIKRQVRTLIAQLRMAALRKEQGLPATAAPQHFVFAGPPGTGKTTVARVIGKVFAGLGLLEKGQLVEAQRVDLVGKFLGHTAVKTSEVIDLAMDGVLFIDEAYALSNSGYAGGRDAFGEEALQVLLKRAEDDRDRLVVILAGYPHEMAELLATNPGLSSRFTTRVDFPSYSADELFRIAQSRWESQGDILDEDAARVLAASCVQVVDEELIDQLGNGRFIRELCRKAAAVRDLRLYEEHGGSGTLTHEEITTVRAADISRAYQGLHGSTTPP
ncbi:AAA family ATPase [Streptomyces sp. NPDC057445]|uniref:AAA family ATPase n=1 Tax=Streptomyces sp. NPDC057445 TaxID=3346136 RepID=UPI0036B72408